MIKNINCILMALLLLFFSCSKSEKTSSPSGGNGDNSQPTQSEDKGSSGSSSEVESSSYQVEKALFTNPQSVASHTSDPNILDQLKVYIDATQKGATIYMSIYELGYAPIIDALKNAYQRGVEIHLMIDSSRETTRNFNASTFPEFWDLESPSELVEVNNDSHVNVMNHEKVTIFSEVNLPEGKVKYLVFATSSNFKLGATKRVNDAVVMTNKRLYDAFQENWENIAYYAAGGMANFQYQAVKVNDSMSVYFFPRRRNGNWDGHDNIKEELDKLDESGYSGDTVRILMAFWSGGRIRIAKKLTSLQQNGVQVQIIVNDKASQAVKDELKKIHDAGGDVKILNTKNQYDHSKCMLIKGKIDGKHQKVILTGSHNYNDKSLEYSNEFILRLENSSLFPEYWHYFNELNGALDDSSNW